MQPLEDFCCGDSCLPHTRLVNGRHVRSKTNKQTNVIPWPEGQSVYFWCHLGKVRWFTQEFHFILCCCMCWGGHAFWLIYWVLNTMGWSLRVLFLDGFCPLFSRRTWDWCYSILFVMIQLDPWASLQMITRLFYFILYGYDHTFSWLNYLFHLASFWSLTVHRYPFASLKSRLYLYMYLNWPCQV